MKLFRRRMIPDEIIELKDDIIISSDEEHIFTKWDALHLRDDLHHGFSCYYLKKGIKVSKFYREDNSLKCWYCDITNYSYDGEQDAYICKDLLADVIVNTNGSVEVVDLDELSKAFSSEMISRQELCVCLNQLDELLKLIYSGKFATLQKEIDAMECI